MEKQFKKKAEGIWMDRSHARRIARDLKGAVMVTQANHISQNSVKEYDCFDVQVFHETAYQLLITKMKLDKNTFKDG
jgi:hypothetical protein